ncbi:hypothetical protein PHET_08560 [Paragonimus heterotremus]|uniref:H/ACA ribonucleoprotein complex non-core subunit NAF1 n=1 Tax=Paragonimus heterotremus TaxID=100268 RepID=A0A8J4WV42_9TREM|nr:hypothetical protein PHET_08560 [Paragonimus heterotremus]
MTDVIPRLTVIDSSSDTDDSSDSEPIPTPQIVLEKKRPPLFNGVPDYVPKVPERLTSTALLTPLGSVTSVLDGCVVIKAQSSAPVLDTGSALFLDGGEPLGEVYETFGPVSTPLYVVVLPNSACLTQTTRGPSKTKPNRHRFQRALPSDVTEVIIIDPDSEEPEQAMESAPDATLSADRQLPASHEKIPDVHQSTSHSPPNNNTEPSISLSPTDALRSDMEKQPSPTLIPNVNVGDTVYFVRNNPDLSIPVFYSQLIQMKGSDASWVGDVEPPPDELEFSDDEKERIYKRSLRVKRHTPFSDSPLIGDAPGSSFIRSKGNRPAQRGRPHHNRINSISSNTESNRYGVNAPQDPSRLHICSPTNFTQPPAFNFSVPSSCYNSPSFGYNQPPSGWNQSDAGHYVSESAPPCFPAPGYSDTGRLQFEGSNFVQPSYAPGHAWRMDVSGSSYRISPNQTERDRTFAPVTLATAPVNYPPPSFRRFAAPSWAGTNNWHRYNSEFRSAQFAPSQPPPPSPYLLPGSCSSFAVDFPSATAVCTNSVMPAHCEIQPYVARGFHENVANNFQGATHPVCSWTNYANPPPRRLPENTFNHVQY